MSHVLDAAELPPPRVRKRRRRLALPIYVGLVIAYLLVPIAVMILYSFNGSNAHLPTVTFKLQGFTTEWYREWNKVPGLTPAFYLSLRLAFASAITAAVLGTLLALALVRYRFRGKGVTNQVLFLNIAAPEIVLGAALLGFFITLNLPKGFLTLFLAHVMFSVAYVTLTVRARLIGFDRSIEEAAQDLGATAWVTFRKITLPLIFPAVLAGALLAFALVDRRLRDLELRLGLGHDVPAVGLGRGQGRHPAAGVRARDDDLRGGHRVRGAEPRVAGQERSLG